MRVSVGLCFVAALLLSGCGSTPTDRAASGAVIGAAGGALAGALVGMPATGAVLGGAVGATAGALTDPSQVNLGKPVWK